MYKTDHTRFLFFVDEVKHFQDALLDMVADESYHIPTEANNCCLKIAREILAELKSPSQQSSNFCSWLTKELEKITEQSFFTATSCVNREKLWTKFYQLQVSQQFTEKWKLYLQEMKLPDKAVFFQSCTSILFDNIIKIRFPVDCTADTSEVPLSFEEENAIRYVGGYVVATLKKQNSDRELLAGLNHLTERNPDVIRQASSAMWVREVNRGGITHITEAAQDLFLSIEACIKTQLTLNKAHMLDATTRHRLQNEIFSNCDVQFSWCMTGVNLQIDDEKAEELLEMCINLWITIRENSFANSIQEFYKQQTKKTMEKAKPLRKTVD